MELYAEKTFADKLGQSTLEGVSRKALDFRADTTERRPPQVTYRQKEIGINQRNYERYKMWKELSYVQVY